MADALRVFTAGPSECGKTKLNHELFVARFARRLTFDFARETHKWNPHAITVYSYAELREALGDLADVRQWHLALRMDAGDVKDVAPKVCRLLAHPTTSDDENTYARSIGGLVVDCSEMHVLAPNGATPADVQALVTRGRHEKISLVCATQAPALVDRRFSENAQILIAFSTQEHTVWKYWAAKTCGDVADQIDEQPLYHAAYLVKASRTIYWLDDRRRVLRVTDFKGRPLNGAAGGDTIGPEPAHASSAN